MVSEPDAGAREPQGSNPRRPRGCAARRRCGRGPCSELLSCTWHATFHLGRAPRNVSSDRAHVGLVAGNARCAFVRIDLEQAVPKIAIASAVRGVGVGDDQALGLLIGDEHVVHRIELVDAPHGADINSGPILHTNTGVGDDGNTTHFDCSSRTHLLRHHHPPMVDRDSRPSVTTTSPATRYPASTLTGAAANVCAVSELTGRRRVGSRGSRARGRSARSQIARRGSTANCRTTRLEQRRS